MLIVVRQQTQRLTTLFKAPLFLSLQANLVKFQRLFDNAVAIQKRRHLKLTHLNFRSQEGVACGVSVPGYDDVDFLFFVVTLTEDESSVWHRESTQPLPIHVHYLVANFQATVPEKTHNTLDALKKYFNPVNLSTKA